MKANSTPRPVSYEVPLPHSVDAERAVLGALFLEPSLWPVISDRLAADDFFIVRHAWVYEAMQECAVNGYGLDYLTVTQQLENSGRLAELGGAAYVLQLVNSTPSSLNAEGYANIVKQMAWRRRLTAYAGSLMTLAHRGEMSIRDIHQTMVTEMNQLGGGGMKSRRTANDLANQFIDEASAAMRDSTLVLRGYNTGFTMLNTLLGSTYRPGSFTVIGAYTSQGKTQVAIQMAYMAARQGPCLYVSLESLPETLFNRQIAALSGVPLTRVHERDLLGEGDFERTLRAAEALSVLPFEIETLDSLRDIEEYVADMSIRYDYQPGMIFVDDIDSLAERAKGNNDYERLKRTNVGLLGLTLRTGWGVVGLKQLLMPTEVKGITNSTKLLSLLTPNIMSFEGGRTIAQKGGNVLTMLGEAWVKEKVYADFKHADLPEGFVMFRRLKTRDGVGGVMEVPLRINAAIPRFENEKPANGKRPVDDLDIPARDVYRG